MSKYIIKNCPAIYGDEYCKENAYEDGSIYCQDCTDCVLKQIVNHCKDVEEYSDDYYTRPILEKLDIREAE